MMFSQETPSGRQPPDSLFMTPTTPGFPSPFPGFHTMWMSDWTQLLNSHPEMGTADLGLFPNFAQNPFGDAFKNGLGADTMAKLPVTAPLFPTPSRTGGRKPKEEHGLSPEEIEKRMRRRERNKEAAARCRQRRLNLTETLVQNIQTLQLENHRKKKEQQTIKTNLKKLIDVISNNCLSHLSPHDKQLVMSISREFGEIDNKLTLPEINIKEEFVERPRHLNLCQLPILNTWFIPEDYSNYNGPKDAQNAEVEPTDLSPSSLSSIGHVHDIALA